MASLYQPIAEKARVALATFEQEATQMAEAGADDVTHPRFGNYAVLLMGIESQRATLAWATWLASRLSAAGAK